ncbi:MATE family efflux transporter [Candidatus Epulonipiscium viviparus]|uniref:MATE family efflux transporter n=1 Tax=Candidatus Epulonipiscium viviparus TaxID=420336 RepID=UPI0027380493|nr:MATE family efflux transporter [Candidatus Epulopiscium viviparus]
MNIQISDNFNYSKLIKFTIPSIIMMIVTSVYGVVDGLFVSNYVGKNAFTSLNLVMPFISIFSAFSFMMGIGGCALVAKFLGEGKKEKANEVFSMIITVLIIGAIFFAAFGIVFIESIAVMLGATPELLADCVTYATIMFIALPGFMLQTTFQTFAVVADKPNMGLSLSILSGISNVVLDFLFMAVFEWGIAGAAWATGISQMMGGFIPLIYFVSKRNVSRLKLVKFKWDLRSLLTSAINGSSEMMSTISLSLVSMLYNLQLMKFFGVNGVSAYGIIMYGAFIFVGVFIGYTIGVSPIISYHYGADNKPELKSLLKKSVVLMMGAAVVLTVVAEVCAPTLAKVFVGYDAELLQLSTTAFRIYSLSYLVSNLNIFASAFFTALNNGFVSALISFLRTLVLQAIMIMVLPYIIGVNGIWFAVLFAEIECLIATIFLFKANRKRYGYY